VRLRSRPSPPCPWPCPWPWVLPIVPTLLRYLPTYLPYLSLAWLYIGIQTSPFPSPTYISTYLTPDTHSPLPTLFVITIIIIINTRLEHS
jgi:hypothetical protein